MTNNVLFDFAIVIGTSTIAYQCAKLLKTYLPVEVIEYPDISYSSLESCCFSDLITYKKMNENSLFDYLDGLTVKTLIISAFNTYIFPSRVVDKDNIRIVNYHNSLLPYYAGRNAEAWVIFMQESQTGVTWHRVSNIVDGGNILGQKCIDLDENITALKLIKEQHLVAFDLFKQLLPDILNDYDGTEQNEKEIQYHTSKEIPGNGEIDLEWALPKIYAFIRALDYGPLQLLGIPHIMVNGKRYGWRKYRWINRQAITDKRVVIQNEKKILISAGNEGIILENIYLVGEKV